MAVSAADHPGAPLFGTDSLHGTPERVPLDPHWLQSIELLCGALAYLFHIPAIYLLHWLVAGLAAIFAIFAYAKLFRIIDPAHTFWGVFTVPAHGRRRARGVWEPGLGTLTPGKRRIPDGSIAAYDLVWPGLRKGTAL